jgi:hypothetical protein
MCQLPNFIFTAIAIADEKKTLLDMITDYQ